MTKAPYIFDIQRGSTVDGPGVRTTVFFKGCNLRCRWCHNPESQNPMPQLAFFKQKCMGCGVCRAVCKNEECVACGECAEYCYAEARKIYGKLYTADEVYAILVRDKSFYDATGGGVTFSGGECMLYPDFVRELGEKCKADGISVAIDTAGCVPKENFERVLPIADLFLYDVKCIDPELHEKYTGKSNELILSNLDMLIALGKKIIVRVPVIPYFNEGEELEKIKAYVEKRGLPYELLPYHDMGESKKEAIEAAKK